MGSNPSTPSRLPISSEVPPLAIVYFSYGIGTVKRFTCDMPSTFSAFDFSNSKSEEDDFRNETRAGAANVTLAFIGCPSSHTEISLDFDASPKDSENSEPEDAPVKSPKRRRKTSSERGLMPPESPVSRLAKIKRNRELELRSNKKQPIIQEASKTGENSRKRRDVCHTKYAALERGETQSKNSHEDRVSPMLFGNSSKLGEKSPRKTASLHKQTPADTGGTAQRKRSRERSGEVKALTRLRTCLKGLKTKPKAEDLMETRMDNVQLGGRLGQTAPSSRQMRLPKAQGDMEMPPKGAEGSFIGAGRYGGPNCSRNDAKESCQVHHRSKSRGYPTIDRMFADVLKTLIIQSGPESSPGVTSIYDVGHDKEHFSYGSSCTLKVERETGKSTDSGSELTMRTTTTCGDKPSGGDFARECLRAGDTAAKKGPAGGEKARGFENKNCSHYVEGGFEDETLGGFDPEAMSDTSEDLYDAFDEVHLVSDRLNEEQVEIQRLKIAPKVNVAPLLAKEPDSVGDTWKTCFDQTVSSTGSADKFITLNKNNSLKDRGPSNGKVGGEKSQEDSPLTSSNGPPAVENVPPGLPSDAAVDPGWGGYQGAVVTASEIVITLTPPSPGHSSSTQSLSSSLSDGPADSGDLLGVPVVPTPLNTRIPSGADLAEERSPGSSVTSDQELVDICNAGESRSFGFDGRPTIGQGRRSVIRSYIEKTRDMIKKVRSRSASPMNVFAKINKMCGRGKEELQLIKSWSFSEVVNLMDKTGLYRSAVSKNRYTDVLNSWGMSQNDDQMVSEESGVSAQMPNTLRPGDALSPIFCLNPFGSNDILAESPGESFNAPGSNRNYASCSYSHRPHPVHGKASTSSAIFHSWKGRGLILEKPDHGTLVDGRRRKSAFCKYEQVSCGGQAVAPSAFRTLAQVSEEAELASRPPEDDGAIAAGTSREVERGACTQASQSCSRVMRYRKCEAEESGEKESDDSVPAKSQSLVQVGDAGLGESCAGDVMAILTQGVTIKRYPSFTDLTELNVDDCEATKRPVAAEALSEYSEGDKLQPGQMTSAPSRLEMAAGSDQITFPDTLQLGQSLTTENGLKKLTPPNSPNVGILTGARVQTIVSLLESCTVLRTEREQSLTLAVGASESLSRFLKKNDAGGVSPEDSNGPPHELTLPSPPVTSPGQSSSSSSDTLESVASPPETFQSCEPSTSRCAAPTPPRTPTRNEERGLARETFDEVNDEINMNADLKSRPASQNDEPGRSDSSETVAYLPTQQPNERIDQCKQRCQEIINNDRFLLIDPETSEHACAPGLKDVPPFITPFKGAGIAQTLKIKSKTFSKVKADINTPAAPCYVIDKPFIGVRPRGVKDHAPEDTESEQILRLQLPQSADDNNQEQTRQRVRCSRRIKWVTDSSSDDDDDDMSANSSASSSFSDRSLRFHSVIDFKDTLLENFPIRPANKIQGHGFDQVSDSREIESARSSQSGLDADRRGEDGVRSDSNNNISIASENCWIRLYKGLPCKDKTARLRPADVCWKSVCAGRKHRHGDAEANSGYKGVPLSSRHPPLDSALVIDVSEEKKKNLYSLLRASPISGVSDPEDDRDGLKKSLGSLAVRSIESPVTSIHQEQPVEDVSDGRSESGHANTRPYRSIRKEETFTTDPRRTSTRSRDAKASQSYQRQGYSTIIPRLSRNTVRLPKHPKRGDSPAELILFDRTSPDVSHSGSVGCQAMAETCVVPKIPKSLWEGTSAVQGQEEAPSSERVGRKTPPPPPPPPAVKQSRLRARLQRSEVNVPRASDFVKRSSFQIERCEELIKKSADVIRASQIMVERSKRRLETTAAEMKRLTNT
ncbi:hypothetical protein Btru_033467 [Bulinus truncatus]|nr:hypothetical protein Btru_033467 [Bulinus truncatus]